MDRSFGLQPTAPAGLGLVFVLLWQVPLTEEYIEKYGMPHVTATPRPAPHGHSATDTGRPADDRLTTCGIRPSACPRGLQRNAAMRWPPPANPKRLHAPASARHRAPDHAAATRRRASAESRADVAGESRSARCARAGAGGRPARRDGRGALLCGRRRRGGRRHPTLSVRSASWLCCDCPTAAHLWAAFCVSVYCGDVQPTRTSTVCPLRPRMKTLMYD